MNENTPTPTRSEISDRLDALEPVVEEVQALCEEVAVLSRMIVAHFTACTTATLDERQAIVAMAGRMEACGR